MATISYRFCDIEEKERLLRQQLLGESYSVVQKAIDRMIKKHMKFYGEGSKYLPHQGKKECARRVKQMSKEA